MTSAGTRIVSSVLVLACTAASAGCAVRAAAHGTGARTNPTPSTTSGGASPPRAVEPGVPSRALAPVAAGAPARPPLPVNVPASSGSPSTPAGASGSPDPFASAYVYTAQQAIAASSAVHAGPPKPAPARSRALTPSATAPEAKLPAEPPPVPPAAPSARADGRLGLSVVASSPTIAVGEVVTVDVVASAATAILDSPLHIDFDPRVLAYVDATPGQFLTQGGSSVVFIADGETHPGDAALALGRVQREMGASGTGLLCRVRLRGVSSGTTSVDVGEARAWGVSNDEVPVVVSAARVDVR